jgi:hypothetical protein
MRALVLAALLAAVPAMFLLSAAPAAGQRVTKLDGNKLLALCSGKNSVGCEAYLDGVADAMAEEPTPRRACIPAAVTTAQLHDVVLKLLHNEPQKRELPAGRIVVHAYAKAFPCTP